MLVIRTGSDALLSAYEVGGHRIASFFADHVPSQVAEHRCMLERLKADIALASAAAPDRARQLEARRDRLCERHHRRMQSVCRQAAEFAAELARRQGVVMVQYDDRDQSHADAFLWRQLRCLVGETLAAYGIALSVTATDKKAQTGDRQSPRDAILQEPTANPLMREENNNNDERRSGRNDAG